MPDNQYKKQNTDEVIKYLGGLSPEEANDIWFDEESRKYYVNNVDMNTVDNYVTQRMIKGANEKKQWQSTLNKLSEATKKIGESYESGAKTISKIAPEEYEKEAFSFLTKTAPKVATGVQRNLGDRPQQALFNYLDEFLNVISRERDSDDEQLQNAINMLKRAKQGLLLQRDINGQELVAKYLRKDVKDLSPREQKVGIALDVGLDPMNFLPIPKWELNLLRGITRYTVKGGEIGVGLAKKTAIGAKVVDVVETKVYEATRGIREANKFGAARMLERYEKLKSLESEGQDVSQEMVALREEYPNFIKSMSTSDRRKIVELTQPDALRKADEAFASGKMTDSQYAKTIASLARRADTVDYLDEMSRILSTPDKTVFDKIIAQVRSAKKEYTSAFGKTQEETRKNLISLKTRINAQIKSKQDVINAIEAVGGKTPQGDQLRAEIRVLKKQLSDLPSTKPINVSQITTAEKDATKLFNALTDPKSPISGATFNKHFNKILQDAGVDKGLIAQAAGITPDKLPQRVLARVMTEDPERFRRIENLTQAFQKDYKPEHLAEANRLLSESPIVQEWSNMENALGLISPQTKKVIANKFSGPANNRKIKSVMAEFFGTTNLSELTEKEAQILLHVAKDANTKGGLNFPELMRLPEGRFIDDMSRISKRDPLLRDKFLTFTVSPRLLFQKFGYPHIYDALMDAERKTNVMIRNYKKELLGLKKVADKVDKDSGRKIFKAIEAGDLTTLDPRLQPIAERMRGIYRELADAQGLPPRARLENYITHTMQNMDRKELISQLKDAGFNVTNLNDREINDLIRDVVENHSYISGDVLATLPYMMKNPSKALVINDYVRKRLGSQFYNRDAWAAIDAYLPMAARQSNMRTPFRMMVDIENAMPGTAAAEYLKNMRRQYFGSGLMPMKAGTPGAKFLRATTNNVFVGALGTALDSSIKNLLQGGNTIAELGLPATLRGYRYIMLHPREAYKELLDLGIIDSGRLAELVKANSGKLGLVDNEQISRFLENYGKLKDKSVDVAMMPFQFAETTNRSSAYFAAKLDFIAKNKGKMPEAELARLADQYGKKIVEKTQFGYSRISKAPIMTGPLGGALFQFQTYPAKTAEMLYEWAKAGEYNKIDRWLRFQNFIVNLGDATDRDLQNFTGQGAVPVMNENGQLVYKYPPVVSFLGAVGTVAYNELQQQFNKNVPPANINIATGPEREAVATIKNAAVLPLNSGRVIKRLLDKYTTFYTRGVEVDGRRVGVKYTDEYGRLRVPDISVKPFRISMPTPPGQPKLVTAKEGVLETLGFPSKTKRGEFEESERNKEYERISGKERSVFAGYMRNYLMNAFYADLHKLKSEDARRSGDKKTAAKEKKSQDAFEFKAIKDYGRVKQYAGMLGLKTVDYDVWQKKNTQYMDAYRGILAEDILSLEIQGLRDPRRKAEAVERKKLYRHMGYDLDPTENDVRGYIKKIIDRYARGDKTAATEYNGIMRMYGKQYDIPLINLDKIILRAE